MRILVAFVIVCQSFGSPYVVAEVPTWRFSQLSMIKPQPFQFFQNTLFSPYQESPPYRQEYNWLSKEYENYKLRAINQRQSALFGMLKCLIESNLRDYCRMLMPHLKKLFEPEQTPPITILQPIVIEIKSCDQSEQNQKPLPSKSSALSIEKFPENGRKPSLLSNATEVSNFTSEDTTPVTVVAADRTSVKDSTTEASIAIPLQIYSKGNGLMEENDKDKNTITETTTEHIEPTTPLDTLVLEENISFEK